MMFLRSFLFASLAFVGVRAYGQDDFGFNLEDALNEDTARPQEANDFDLNDAFDEDSRVQTGQDDISFNLEDALNEDPVKPQGQDDISFNLEDALNEDPVKPQGNDDGFDLSDALRDDTAEPPAGDFDDSDLEHVTNSDYRPDKTKSKVFPDQDSPAETDLFSKLLMTILDGTSEHFKKICFSLMEMLKDLYNSQQD